MSFIGEWLRKWFFPHRNAPMNPVDTDVYLQLHRAHACLMSGELQQAERFATEALQQAEKSSAARSEYALSLLVLVWMEQESYEKATEFLTRFIAEKSPSSFVFRNRGIAYWYAGRLPKALDDYESAGRLGSSDPLILLGRGQILVELNQPQQAAQDLQSCLEIASKHPDARTSYWMEIQAYARNGLGFAYSRLSETAESSRQFAMSIDLRPENAWVYFNRAQAYEKSGERTKALSDYIKSIEMSKPKLPVYKRDSAKARLAILSGS
jgi:tetratricopeptide (TPR) repeat protein